MNFIEEMPRGVSGKDVCHPRIKTRTENSHNTFLFEPLLIGPLPAVFKMGLVKGLVIGRINIMDSCRETCIHDMQILIREGEIENNIRPELAYEVCKFRYIVGVNPSRLDVSFVSNLNVIFDGLALGEGSAGNHNLPKKLTNLPTF